MIEPLFSQDNKPCNARIERDVRVIIDKGYPEFERLQASLHPLLNKRDCSKVQQIVAEYTSSYGAIRSYVNLEI